MSKHTPGPWIVDDRFGHCIRSVSGTVIANTDNANQYDNARLIAAAPDLLAALESTIALADEMLDRQYDGNRSVRCQAVYDQCVAAIAKAKGE